MMYQLSENPQGPYYREQDGKYYDLLICSKATGPKGVNVGWKEYKSLKSALKALRLKAGNE